MASRLRGRLKPFGKPVIHQRRSRLPSLLPLPILDGLFPQHLTLRVLAKTARDDH
jgi:hypothetical protein